MKNQSKWIKIVVFVCLAIGLVVLDSHYGWSAYLGNMDNLMFLKNTVDENLFFALFLYIVITIVGCVVLALPGITFAIIAGMLFGSFWGIFACLFATTLGAMLAFLVGRFFLKDAVKPMLEKNALMKKLLFSNNKKNDLIVLMITRMVPVFPYNLQNFAYGITDIGFWKYSILTFVFMFPGVSFYTIGAAGLTAGEDKWKYFLVAGALAAAVTLAGVYIKKKFLGEEERAIILFTRIPVAGKTKTRMMPFLTGEECAELHACFIKDAYAACKNASADTVVFYAPEGDVQMLKHLLDENLTYIEQSGENLGIRMKRAVEQTLAMGYQKVVLIGTDIPQITSNILENAFAGLETTDIVINPTADGGYYLIGMKENYDEVWNVERYGTNTVIEDTLSQMEKAGLKVSTGDVCRDMDTEEDLRILYQEYQKTQQSGYTWQYLKEHLSDRLV